MEYRKFGKLNWKGSILGFGAMRLPVIDGKMSNVDEEQTRQMVEYAVEHGVNYVDTAFPYHEGQSERCMGRILKDGYRDKVKLATKLPSWPFNPPLSLIAISTANSNVCRPIESMFIFCMA